MSLPIYQRVAVTDAGDVIPGAEYTVINENTGVAAPIYSDRTGATLLTAPYFADSAGTIQFFIAQGTTFRVAASGGVGTYTDRYVYGVAEAVLVNSNGKIGIGTVTPNAAIQVAKGTATPGGPLPGDYTASACFGNDSSNNSYGLIMGADGNGAGYINAQRTDGSNTTYPLYIQPNGGNVGIGTTSVDFASTGRTVLHVEGASGALLALEATGNRSYIFQNGADLLVESDSASGNMIFGTNVSTERMRITSAGELVVGGTTAIGSSSTIYQAGDSRNATTFVSSAPTQPYGLQVRYTVANPNSTVNGFFEAYAWNGSSYLQKFVVRSNGGIANFQANDVNLSDESEKKNITDPGSTWSCLKEWDVIQYHYNFDADDSDKKYGVIAQQVEAYCPEVISDFKTQEKIDEVLWVDDDELPEGVSVGDVKTAAQDEVIRKGVREQQMMWMAIKALQEAQTRIESLEERITILEAK